VTSFLDVAVVGAGPYGLSIGAHLAARGIAYRVFGTPMHFWRRQVPKGMLLKSEGYASNLSDPGRSYKLSAYCAEHGLPYADEGLPIPAATFAAYGLAFMRRFGIAVEDRQITAVDRSGDGFGLRLDDGGLVSARAVVMAAGVARFPRIPALFAGAPGEIVSHSTEHHELDGFAGRSVIVLGGGASAVCCSALLQEAGADVTAVARSMIFHDRLPLDRPFLERLREPHTSVGSGWRPAFMAYLPLAFRAIPEKRRVGIARRASGPAGGYAMKERFERVPLLAGYEPAGFSVEGGRALVRLRALDGGPDRSLAADHVVLATGFETDLAKLGGLSPGLLGAISTVQGAPRLSTHFESSVKGLYFVGPAAGYMFGPIQRFVVGADFAARRTARHIGRTVSRPYARGLAVANAR
jgi:glycine/D-amino acid oxidase-like deaminating enzyme